MRHEVLRRYHLAALGLAVAATVMAVATLSHLADPSTLREAGQGAATDPTGVLGIGIALCTAFSLRAAAWTRILPGLGFGHANAAVHVSLGGNHLLPFRLGEPLRIVSVVRRSGIAPTAATSSVVALRSADIVSLVLIGFVAGPGVLSRILGPWGLAIALGVTLLGLSAVAHLSRRRGTVGDVAVPDLLTLAMTVGAWLLEATVVWRVAGWSGVHLSPSDALVVLAVAVSAQLVAVTPAGIGTYEAAATAALVSVGVPFSTAISVAVSIHLAKTFYSLIAGAVAVFLPRPGLLGRWRLPATQAKARLHPAAPPAGPIVLFLPAHNEEATVASVVRAAPPSVRGRRVIVLVIDDGSTDETVSQAAAAGAEVVSHATNRGLGAAVQTGLGAAIERGAAAVAFCDADGEYDPGELERLLDPILTRHAHYVVGSRFAGTIETMQPHRRVGNRILTRWVRFVVRHPVTDGQSGYRAFSALAAEHARVAHDYNYAQVLTIDLIQRGFGYHEVPISYRFRTAGRSFIRLGTYLRRVVPTVWRMLNQEEHPPWPTTRPISGSEPVGTGTSASSSSSR